MAAPALIGPNAILQTLAPLDRHLGRSARDALLKDAGIARLPDGHAMIPEADAVTLFRALVAAHPAAAPGIAAEAGEGTADYILAHRIPAPAKALLRRLPRALAARALARAIARHAWTFAGSGAFQIAARRPLTFEIAANPLAVMPGGCVWHASVFTRLFRSLADPRTEVDEAACCARGTAACRFRIIGARDAARRADPRA